MQSISQRDDGEFPSRFQHGTPPPRPGQFAARSGHRHHHHPHHQTAAEQPRSVLRLQPSARHHQYDRRSNKKNDHERGEFSRPHRMTTTQAASHDSHDDDGETSSASEDSAFSSGYPSPSRASDKIFSTVGKRSAPSSGFALPPSQRSRKSETSSNNLQARWSPGASSRSNSPDVTGGNPGFEAGQKHQYERRQLPRLAALETFHRKEQTPQSYQPHRSHDFGPTVEHDTQRQHQQLHHPRNHPHHHGGARSGSSAHTSLQSRNGTPMQLPPLLTARVSSPSSSIPINSTGINIHQQPTTKKSAPASSPTTDDTCTRSSQSLSPSGLRLSPTAFPLPRSVHAHQQQQQQHSQQQEQRQQEEPNRHHFRRETDSYYNNQFFHNTTTEGAQRQSQRGPSSGIGAQTRWLPSTERRQVPRIEALCETTAAAAAAPVTSSPGPSLASIQHNKRWDPPAWPEPTTSRASAGRTSEHAAFRGDGGHGSQSDRVWGSPPVASGAWTDRRYPQQQQQQRQSQQQQKEYRRHSRPVQHSTNEAIHQPGTNSSRTPSPALRQHHQQPRQRRPSPPPVSASARSDRRSEWDAKANSSDPPSVEKQILQQYLAHLNPKASREVWSHDEEEVLWRAQKEYGNAWNYISRLLPGRSENAVKNHWYTQMRMFIGQRGNNSSSSKPSPPPSSSDVANQTSLKSVNRQAKAQRKVEEDRAEQQRQEEQQRRQQEERDAAAARAAAVAAAEAALAAARVAEVAEANRQAREEADRDEPEDGSVRAESEARAEAVAALGMLFSQSGDTSGDESASTGASRSTNER